MERLTVKCDDGHWGLSLTIYDKAIPSRILEKLPIAIDRLAAYEDTGLTPEGIIELKGSWRAACKFYGINPASSISNAPLTLDELREMVDEAVYIVELHVEGEKAMIVDETAYEIVHEYGPSRLVYGYYDIGRYAVIMDVHASAYYKGEKKEGVNFWEIGVGPLIYENYGRTWLAYRRKPEEETP